MIDTTPIIIFYNRICYNLKRVIQMHHPKEPHHYTYFLKEVCMKLSELLTINTSIKNQLNKAEKEIVEKVAALQAAIDKLTQQMADVELTDEQAQSVLDVQAAGQSLDDLNADPEPEPTPES